MSTSEERGRLSSTALLSHELQIELAHTLKDKGYSNSAIAHIMRIEESAVRTLLEPSKETINWGYNCLTTGVHHGRPEKIWNLPLGYAARVFPRDALKALVVSRIYNDALQFVDHAEIEQKSTGERVRFSLVGGPEWATRVREIADERYMRIFQHKVGELSKYYDEPRWKDEQVNAARLNIENKLNPHYEPLHSHDSINMLCRILGTQSSIEASK